MKHWLFLLFIVLQAAPLSAQRNEILVDNIRTLRVEADGTKSLMPMLRLNSSDALHISFDDMTHVYTRYSYRIEHLDCDFKPSSELLETDYVRSTQDEILIEDYTESMNTTINYTHYAFTIPNADCRPLLSGNYRLTVSAENENDELQPVLRVYFSVLEEKASVALLPTTNTDIDYNAQHQQIGIDVNLQSLPLHDAAKDVCVYVLQNNRWDNAVKAPSPTYVNDRRLVWSHSKPLIFSAGNEYRAFEMLSTTAPGMHIDGVHWIEPFYHATITTDLPRRNYLYEHDRNGESVIRNWENSDDATESDYVMTHFTLSMDEKTDYNVYLNGQWTDNRFLPQYKMSYNTDLHAYTADVLLKTGYYSYQYLCVDRDGIGHTAPIEGDYFQTENVYTALVYYRRPGDRYWQLVATTSPSYKP